MTTHLDYVNLVKENDFIFRDLLCHKCQLEINWRPLQFSSSCLEAWLDTRRSPPAPASYNPDNRFVRQTEPSIQIPQIFHNGEDEQVDTYLHILFHTDIYFQKQGGNNFNILPIYLTGCIEAPSAGTGSFPGIHHLKSFTQVMQLLY